jgi:hypothetical protein
MTPRSCFESLIFGDLVQGFTEAHLVEGPDHVPVLRKFDSELLPKHLVAFNDRGRGQSPEDTGIHFYKRDQTFSSVVLNPLGWVDRIFDYKCVLTPDVTLSAHMPKWQRVRNTVYARAAGAVWQSRGIEVLPSLRWVSSNGYDFVMSGLAPGTCFAVSTYGILNDPEKTRDFSNGLKHFQRELKPQEILIYGRVGPQLLDELQTETQVRILPSGFRHFQSDPNDANQAYLF